MEHFEDSVHVQHLRLHEREYSDFIEAVLTETEDSNEHEGEEDTRDTQHAIHIQSCKSALLKLDVGW